MNPVWAHVFIPVLLAGLSNGIIYRLGITQNKYQDKRNPYLPPGYVIGTIWMVLFGLLGYAHYLIYSVNQRSTRASLAIVGLFLFCLAYPVFTGLRVKSGLLLNLATLILAFVVAMLVLVESASVVKWFIPLLAWATFVNVVFVVECSNKY
jgi:tryptophan-rich sensory protein